MLIYDRAYIVRLTTGIFAFVLHVIATGWLVRPADRKISFHFILAVTATDDLSLRFLQLWETEQ